MLVWHALRSGRPGGERAADRGTTLVELTVATAIMTTLFAAIIPVFVGIRRSAQARWAGLEMVQNARVLNDQLCRHLAQAKKVLAVSASTEDGGFVEFEAQDGVVYRCAVGARRYIEFGPVDRPQELAGPVEYLRFACYSDRDFDTPVSTPGDARLVCWEARFQNADSPVQSRSVTGACCLRAQH